MEPLSALGLAADVAQFIEYGISMFRDAEEINDYGSTVSTGHLTSLTNDFWAINTILQRDYSGSVLDPMSTPSVKVSVSLSPSVKGPVVTVTLQC